MTNANISELLLESKQIYEKALKDYTPSKVIVAVSGGDDSLTTLAVAHHLGIKIDYVIHGNTRTGVKETTQFVRDYVKSLGIKYIESDAKSSYSDYVLRKGFFGKGVDAHGFAYRILKATHFRHSVSKHIRKRKRNVRVLFLNGVRVEESDNRADNYGDNPYRQDPAAKSNIWVNLIHWWTKEDCIKFLEYKNVKRNPVAICLGRSGECLCGTMQTQAVRMQVSKEFPEWGKWIDDLEREVIGKGFTWRWGENINKYRLSEMNGQLNMFGNFQPMCTGCKSIMNK